MEANTSVKVVLTGLLKQIKPSIDHLAPVTEAFLNSLESIELRQRREPNHKGVINITLGFLDQLDSLDELEFIEIEDNGEGFNDTHFERYKNLLDDTKGFNNRGSGRVQLLHRFTTTAIRSVYSADKSYKKRSFNFDSTYFVYGETVADSVDENPYAVVRMKSPYKDQPKFNGLTAQALKDELIDKYMLKFYLLKDNLPKISIKCVDQNGLLTEEVTIDETDLIAPFAQEDIEVSYKKYVKRDGKYVWIDDDTRKATLVLNHFRVTDNEKISNGINLCAKYTTVKHIDIPSLKATSSLNGARHVTAVSAKELDKNVSDSVDQFTLPKKSKIEAGEAPLTEDGSFLLIDDIEDRVIDATIKAHEEVKKAFGEQRKRIEEIAKQHGIPDELVKDIRLDSSDKDEVIVDKLFKAQAQRVASLDFKIRNTYKELEQLDPRKPDYPDELKKKSDQILIMIPQQDKEELARYVIRREMVINILRMAVANDLLVQKAGGRKDNEGLIHDVIFKRKSEHSQEINDLWFLSEEFIHFHACSEIPLKDVTTEDNRKVFEPEIEDDEVLKALKIERLEKRPDVLIFPEEGKIVVIEFKAPEVNVSKHLDQIAQYCTLLETFARKDMNITQFYGYLIGESIESVDVPGRYQKASYGKAWFNPIEQIRNAKTEQNKHLYMEVLTYSALIEKASMRNKNFADKLNIRIPK